MKKAIVLLLALAVLGGAAFAQATVAVSLYGTATLFDTDANSIFAPWGNGYDVVTFKGADKDGVKGFTLTDQNLLNGFVPDAASIRDWSVYYKAFDGKAKFTLGKLRDGSIRLTLPTWKSNMTFGATDRFSGYGVLTNLYLVDGLTLGLNVPVSDVSTPTATVLQSADIGAKYVIDGTGTVIALANLDIVGNNNAVNFGFNFSGVENLSATVLYKGVFAAAATHNVAVGAKYTMDALTAGAEFFLTAAAANTWAGTVFAAYDINDMLYASLDARYNSANAYDVYAGVGYNIASGLSADLTVGFDGGLYYDVGLNYSVSF